MRMTRCLILVVEDDPNDVILIRRAFSHLKMLNPIQVVGDGEQAVEYLDGRGKYSDREQFPLPMLVLLDLKMPRKSGLEVLEWIRNQPGIKRTPVVVLTSSSQAKDINKAYDLGANSYLVKPVAFEALVDMIKTLDMYWLIMNEPPEVKGE